MAHETQHSATAPVLGSGAVLSQPAHGGVAGTWRRGFGHRLGQRPGLGGSGSRVVAVDAGTRQLRPHRVAAAGSAVEAAPDAPVVGEDTHQQQPASALSVRVDRMTGVGTLRVRASSLVGHLKAQPQAHQPQFTAHLLARCVPYGVGEQLRHQQLGVFACLLIDAPLVEAVENSPSRLPDRGVECR
jgi:hypothetical protein